MIIGENLGLQLLYSWIFLLSGKFVGNKKIVGLLVACGLLGAGCGGGSKQDDGSWLQLTPSTVDLNAVEGMQQEFVVVAKARKTISQTFNVGIFDNTGLIQPAVEVKATTPYEYSAKMKVSTTLKPGSYSTRLEVRLCVDSPLTCAKPIEGSPWYVPLNVTVKPASNLTPLTDLPNAGTWQGNGGSIAHTGYVPGRFDPDKFTTRFAYTFTNPKEGAGVGAIEDGVIYLNVSSKFIRAMDEATGKILWSSPLPANQGISGPRIAKGELYVEANIGNPEPVLLNFDKTSGALKGQSSIVGLHALRDMEVQSGGLLVRDNAVIKRINPATRLVDWTSSLPNYSIGLTADAENVYFSDGGNLGILRASDGMVLSNPSNQTPNCSGNRVPATDGKGMLYGTCSQLAVSTTRAIDAANKQNKWTYSDTYVSNLALNGSALYALKVHGMEARSTDNGSLLWSIELDTGLNALPDPRRMLVTDNLAFISCGCYSSTEAAKTVAVDLTTHKVVWSYPHGGEMAISSKGVLYILGSTFNVGGHPSILAAVNLR